MIPRLVTALIFVFCGTMTALLIRSVLYPQGTGLADAPPQAAFDLFAARQQGSDLDVWQGNRIIGRAEITPHGPASRPGRGIAHVTVRLKLLLNPPQGLLGSDIFKLTGEVRLHSDGSVDNLLLDVSLPGSRPVLNLSIRQPAGQAWPALKLTQGTAVLFSADAGQSPDGIMAAMLDNILKSAGIPLDSLTARAAEAASQSTVRSGWFEAGGSRHDGYLFSGGGDDSATRLDLYMANTGEILRLDTPLTGDNQLGLRFLSDSLRPAGTEVPDIREFPVFKEPKP